MSVGVHGFDIPHDRARPTRDMIIIQIPYPPRKSRGGIITPDMSRDLMQHNVMAGRIVKMGPIAFQYKTGDGVERQEAEIGDWVIIRPFAGTMMTGGRVQTINSGYRYVSSFNDVISILDAADMPDPDTLDWNGEDLEPDTVPAEIPSQPRSSEVIGGISR